MEGNDNLRAWGYYDSHNSLKGLNFMSSITGDRKPLIGGHQAAFIANLNGGFHREYTVPTPYYQPVEFNSRDVLLRDNKFYNMLSTGHHNYDVPTDNPLSHHHHNHHHHHDHHHHHHHDPMHMIQQPETSNEEKMVLAEPSTGEINSGPLKKRSAVKPNKSPKTKKPRRASGGPKDGGSGSAQWAKSGKKNTKVIINGLDMDISSIPIPVCSCTGTAQQCYRWGFGGWQSACCTTGMSMYPLPMSTKRRGARIAGRKMSLGAFKKVLERLAAEGYNFSNPIDLRTHWAKHGTNKFVTIK